MDSMGINYDRVPNTADAKNNIISFHINSQNNVTTLSISLMFYGVILNCKSVRGVHEKLQVNQLLRNSSHGRKSHPE